jgi:hypothetical protein
MPTEVKKKIELEVAMPRFSTLSAFEAAGTVNLLEAFSETTKSEPDWQ